MYSLLVKFAKERLHLELLQNGLIHCKSIKYFTELEDGKIRGDSDEAVFEVSCFKNGTFKIKPSTSPNTEWKTLNFMNGSLKKNNPHPLGNLFCLSSIFISPTVQPTAFQFDERFKEFGNYVMLITNQPIFFKRLKKAAQRQRIKMHMQHVAYLDLRKYSGAKTLFQKDIEYSWQQEFRLLIERNDNDLFEFSISSIKDISVIYDIRQQKQFLLKIPE